MNAKQLSAWKEKELERADSLVKQVRPVSPSDITRIYPEFALRGVYTTSLEPYLPVWLLLPFFDQVIVGITPELGTEDQFRQWYGLGVHEILALREKKRVEIRINLPKSVDATPAYLDPFFSEEFPSSARAQAFDTALLGSDKLENLRGRFASLMSHADRSESIDGFKGHPARAYKTAETAYFQLHSLGYQEAAAEFEKLAQSNLDGAFHWLELCRLFLVGPIHYSLGGIHSVASTVPSLRRPPGNQSMVFPAELGRILIDAFNLLQFKSSPGHITLDYCIHAHPEYERARNALMALDDAVRTGQACSVNSTEELRAILAEARTSKERWLRTLRIVAATGLGLATLPLVSLYGLLVGLGFEVFSELPGRPLDAGLERVANVLRPTWDRPHVTLLLGLEKSVKGALSDP